MLSGNTSGLSRSTFGCRSCAVQTRPADILSGGLQLHCCLDRSSGLPCWEGGCFPWVRPLQSVSVTASSDCHGANDGGRKTNLLSATVKRNVSQSFYFLATSVLLFNAVNYLTDTLETAFEQGSGPSAVVNGRH